MGGGVGVDTGGVEVLLAGGVEVLGHCAKGGGQLGVLVEVFGGVRVGVDVDS